MAPKRPSHLDDPPAASSSEEEEEETSSEDEEDEEDESSSEEEEHQAEAAKIDSLPSTPVKPQPKKPDPPAPISNSKPQTHSSSSGSESESETESGSTPDPNVKPLASKPMEPDPTPVKATKPRSKPSSARSSATTKKRPNGEAEATPSKRVKKKDPEPKSQDVVVSPSEDSKKGGGDEKKLFQRLWSDENEIELLKGMLDYTASRGADPAADAAAFFEFVKKSLHVEVTKAQLVDKMKRLRKKYNNNAGRGKKGKDPTFSKPHEQKTYELSKKIWGSVEAATETEKAKDINNGKAKAKDNKNGKAKAKDNNNSNNNSNKNQKGNSLIRSLKEELTESSPVLYKYGEKMEIDGDSGSGLGSCLNGMLRFDKNVWLDERVIKRGLKLIDEEKKVELEERWKEVELAELEVFVKRTELIKDQARLILEAYKDHWGKVVVLYGDNHWFGKFVIFWF